MGKTEGTALGFPHSPRDLANVNEWKIIFDPYIPHSPQDLANVNEWKIIFDPYIPHSPRDLANVNGKSYLIPILLVQPKRNS